jgi:hypothetical protein
VSAWRQVREAAQAVVSRIAERYRDEKPERYGGEVVLSPEQLLADRRNTELVIEDHARRLTREACYAIIGDRWARPGAPRFSFEVDEDENMTSRRPGYGPGTLRLRLDMQTHAADLKLPESNAELTKALIGALAVATVSMADKNDLAGRRLLEGCRSKLHEHGTPEVIVLMGSMVEAAGARRQ